MAHIGTDVIPAVRPNNAQAAQLATEILLANHHGAIGYLGGQSNSLVRAERLAGIRFGLDEAGELEKLYHTVLRSQKAAREAVRPGIRCQALDELARNIIEDAGYGDYFSHNLGHGLGLDVHEVPALSPVNTDVLQVGW